MKEIKGKKTEQIKCMKKFGMQEAVVWVICGLLVTVRCIGFGKIPGGFNQDGALAAVDALALAEYGTDHFGTFLPAHLEAWGYGQMSALLSYLMVPFIKIWGLNPVTARLPLLLASLAGAAAVYGLVKYLKDKKTAAVVLLFLAINPWHFMQSRWALDCNLFPHMFVIGLYFLVTGMDKTKRICLSMFFFALCMYAYGVAFYMVPFFLLASCILLLRAGKIRFLQAALAALTYFAVAWPIYITMFLNFMKWDTVRLPFVTMQYFKDSVRSADILFFSETPLKQLAANIKTFFELVFLQKRDLPWNALDAYGTMYLFSMPFILLGIVLTFYRVRGRLGRAVKAGWRQTARTGRDNDNAGMGMKILLVYWLCSIFTGLCINSVNVNRINIIFYSHIIFAGIGIAFTIEKIRWTLACFLVFYGVGSMMFFTAYFTVWNEEIKQYFQADFLEALDYAEEFECEYYYITPDTQYEGAFHASQVWTLYGMEIDAAYFQGKTDAFLGAEIPYAERFCYRNPVDAEIKTDLDIGYILRTEDMGRFSAEQFSIKQFGRYFVAFPAQYAR